MKKTRELSVGSYKNLPHYSVIGSASNFYYWINEDGLGKYSSWFKGKEAFKQYQKLTQLHTKNKKVFCDEIKKQFI